MKLIYLASPYSHSSLTVEAYRARMIDQIGAGLVVLYPNIAIFPPITISHQYKKHSNLLGTSFKAWSKIDLFVIGKKADELWVVMLPGWDRSIGVKAEIKHAKRCKKPVYYINPETFKKTSTPS